MSHLTVQSSSGCRSSSSSSSSCANENICQLAMKISEDNAACFSRSNCRDDLSMGPGGATHMLNIMPCITLPYLVRLSAPDYNFCGHDLNYGSFVAERVSCTARLWSARMASARCWTLSGSLWQKTTAPSIVTYRNIGQSDIVLPDTDFCKTIFRDVGVLGPWSLSIAALRLR